MGSSSKTVLLPIQQVILWPHYVKFWVAPFMACSIIWSGARWLFSARIFQRKCLLIQYTYMQTAAVMTLTKNNLTGGVVSEISAQELQKSFHSMFTRY
jgi:hypothetical protein